MVLSLLSGVAPSQPPGRRPDGEGATARPSFPPLAAISGLGGFCSERVRPILGAFPAMARPAGYEFRFCPAPRKPAWDRRTDRQADRGRGRTPRAGGRALREIGSTRGESRRGEPRLGVGMRGACSAADEVTRPSLRLITIRGSRGEHRNGQFPRDPAGNGASSPLRPLPFRGPRGHGAPAWHGQENSRRGGEGRGRASWGWRGPWWSRSCCATC